jgi:hypothetical protein
MVPVPDAEPTLSRYCRQTAPNLQKSLVRRGPAKGFHPSILALVMMVNTSMSFSGGMLRKMTAGEEAGE